MQRKKKRARPSGVISYTKGYASARIRRKVTAAHEVNREKNRLTNPTELPRMRQNLC